MTEALIPLDDVRAESRPRKGVGSSRRARRLRRAGNACFAMALLLGVYATVILVWGDPVTALYEHYEQAHLAQVLDASGSRFAAQERIPASPRIDRSQIARLAHAWQTQLQPGQPIGRLVIPKLGVSEIVVHGTRWAEDLSRGPGHYANTSLPGLGKVTAIAGHRTTFGAPFRHIDQLVRGDILTLRMPYGTFQYRVTGHRIVRSDDWSIIKPHGFDALVLSACHPLYSASHRWIVFARLAAVYSTERHL